MDTLTRDEDLHEFIEQFLSNEPIYDLAPSSEEGAFAVSKEVILNPNSAVSEHIMVPAVLQDAAS
jgi:hypothetical protein